MRQRTLAPVSALVFLAGCAAGTPAASLPPSVDPSPEPPLPSPAASAAPTAGGAAARVIVLKVWDADGNATTTNDRESFAVGEFPPDAYPLEFALDVEGSGGADPQISTVQPQGNEQTVFQIEFESETVTATVTETRKDESTLIGGHCYDTETQEIVAGIQGDAVSLDLPIGRSFGCIFINTPVPDLGASN